MPITFAWRPIDEVKSRLDPAYWQPKYAVALDELESSGFPVERLGAYIVEITNGSRERAIFRADGIMYIKAIDVLPTGVAYPRVEHIEEGSVVDTPRSRLEVLDLMVVRSGRGSIGKVAIWHRDLGKATASQHVNLVRVRGINPFWVAAFLKSVHGQAQIERLETGVSRMTHLTYDNVRGLLVALVPHRVEEAAEGRYRQMLQLHDAAMEAKAAGREPEYRERLAYAEQLLQELLAYVENTIRLGPQPVGATENE
jgi:hypothetical protein